MYCIGAVCHHSDTKTWKWCFVSQCYNILKCAVCTFRRLSPKANCLVSSPNFVTHSSLGSGTYDFLSFLSLCSFYLLGSTMQLETRDLSSPFWWLVLVSDGSCCRKENTNECQRAAHAHTSLPQIVSSPSICGLFWFVGTLHFRLMKQAGKQHSRQWQKSKLFASDIWVKQPQIAFVFRADSTISPSVVSISAGQHTLDKFLPFFTENRFLEVFVFCISW